MTADEKKFLAQMQTAIDTALAPYSARLDGHDKQLNNLDQRATAMEMWRAEHLEWSAQMWAKVDDRFDRLDQSADERTVLLREMNQRSKENAARIVVLDRRQNPWLRMWDAGKEIWDARSKVVQGAIAVGAMSGAFIGIVGVVQIVSDWFML